MRRPISNIGGRRRPANAKVLRAGTTDQAIRNQGQCSVPKMKKSAPVTTVTATLPMG